MHTACRLSVSGAIQARIVGQLVLELSVGDGGAQICVLHGTRRIPINRTEYREWLIQREGAFWHVPLLGLPTRCALRVCIGSGKDGVELGRVELERAPLDVAYSPSLCPLMVTSVGRSGSTLLMQYLAEHPEIVVRDVYPMEATIARKIFARLPEQSLNEVSEDVRGTSDRIELLPASMRRAGARALVQAATAYSAISKMQGGAPEMAHFYAEKNLAPEWLVWELCPSAREIVLVRDPRDMICSSLAFNAKRGRVAFGRQDVATDLEYVAHRASMALPWVVEPWRDRKERVHLVRYEDLVARPHDTLSGIFTYLGTDASAAVIGRLVTAVTGSEEVLERHGTSGSALASIGRWRHDLAPELADACEREFIDYMSLFGYVRLD